MSTDEATHTNLGGYNEPAFVFAYILGLGVEMGLSEPQLHNKIKICKKQHK